jgi:hypothetical protein
VKEVRKMKLHLFDKKSLFFKPKKTKAGDLVDFNLYDEITEDTIIITDYGTLKNLNIALNELHKRGYRTISVSTSDCITYATLEKQKTISKE